MPKKKKEFEWLPEQPCKTCGRLIPMPMVYCSTKCREADNEDKEEIFDELEEKAVRRKKRGRRTNKGTFHGKSRGKYRERLP